MVAHDPVVNPSIHYLGVLGATTLWGDHVQCVAQWERIKAERSSEYGSDGAYNFGGCNSHGIRMVGRGWDRSSAANGQEGGIDYNPGSRALCVLVGTDDLITTQCEQMMRDFANEAVTQHGMQWPLRGHSEFVATSCPGDNLRVVIAQINANPGPAFDWGAVLRAYMQLMRRRGNKTMFVAQDNKEIALVTDAAILNFATAGDAGDVMRYLGQDKPVMLEAGQLDLWRATFAK